MFSTSRYVRFISFNTPKYWRGDEDSGITQLEDVVFAKRVEYSAHFPSDIPDADPSLGGEYYLVIHSPSDDMDDVTIDKILNYLDKYGIKNTVSNRSV